MNQILTTFEIIGILAAALSGAMLAIDKRMDLFGVVFIGMVTGLGGGVMRDVILGHIPRSFSNSAYLVAAVLPPLLVFLIAYILQSRYVQEEGLIDRINNIFDALGLGAFAVGGAAVARAVGYEGHFVVVVFSGVITAVGGGVLRDVLLREIPSILKKRVYAIAALAGTLVYYVLLHYGAGEILSAIVCVLLVFILRILATVFHWNFPKAIK